MRPPFPHPPIVRLRPRPDHDEPKAVVGRHGPRQPHTDATFAAVRRLIEQTTLNYQQIAARTGVSIGGVDLSRAPRAAVEDFLANREPPPEPVGPRGRGSRRQREHARMMEKERP